MILNPKIAEALDLDDDDDRAILDELEKRGICLFGGYEVPIEDILEFCPDCEELGERARKGLLLH